MDKKIMNNILSKSRMKIAACEFEKENIKKTNKNIPKLVATFVITTTVTGGLVYATGTAIYDKIWKQPESYKVSNEITEKDKEDAINEEDARKKAEEYLRKIGLDDEINGLKLNKSWQENDITWNIEFTKGSMIMDSAVWTSFLIREYDTIKNIYIKFKTKRCKFIFKRLELLDKKYKYVV